MVSKRGADELIVVGLGIAFELRLRQSRPQAPIGNPRGIEIWIVVTRLVPGPSPGFVFDDSRPQPAPVLRTAWLPNMSLLDRPNAHLCLPAPVAQPPRAPSAMLPSTPVYLM